MNSKNNELLEKVKELLKSEVTPIAYLTWIDPIDIINIENNKVTLKATSLVHYDSLNSRYMDLITNGFNYVTNKKCEVSFVVNGPEEEKSTSQNIEVNNNVFIKNSTLNPKYTFDTFVIGDNNQFAHAAAWAVSEAPGTAYNPLFFYAGVGLGKTHLMHAIGNEIIKNHPEKKVVYLTSEYFTNQLINALKDNSSEKFRQLYRNVDVLLIDDIQFLQNKEKIQEEFFHTFNALHEANKQIIISSDRPPKDLEVIEDRLRSRFAWGLTADISSASYETRLAILRKKVETDHIIIDDNILSNIATKISSNIRELEGVLNKIVAFSTLSNGPITIEMAEKAINDIISQKNKIISAEYIQEVVAKYYDITREDLKGSKRSNDIAYPRQIAMYLCRQIGQMPFTKIGECFGKRDHTTAMHAFNKIESDISLNKDTKLIVDSIKEIILTNK